DDVSGAMPSAVLSGVMEALDDAACALGGARILVLGVAYKRGVGDTRESPAPDVIVALRTRGAVVSYADPHVPLFRSGDIDLKAVTLSDDLLRDANCVLILTDHPEFDYQAAVRPAQLIIDTRQAILPSMEGPARVVRL